MHLQAFIIALLLTSTALNAPQGEICVPRQNLGSPQGLIAQDFRADWYVQTV